MASRNHEYANYVCDVLAPLGPIRWRVMFGGYGVYCGELFFALIVDDVLYFKANAETRPLFEAEDLEPFTYEKQGQRQSLAYYRAPELIFEDEEALRHWGNLALGAALKARKAKPAGKTGAAGKEVSKKKAAPAARKKARHEQEGSA